MAGRVQSPEPHVSDAQNLAIGQTEVGIGRTGLSRCITTGTCHSLPSSRLAEK